MLLYLLLLLSDIIVGWKDEDFYSVQNRLDLQHSDVMPSQIISISTICSS